MPIVPFETYTLNNDNAECGYILVFDCTLGNFVFMNPCDILNGCHINVNNLIDRDTFDWCRIVSSPLISGMEPGNVLRVNMAGDCIEGVDISTIINPSLFDYRVKVSAIDTPDYLENKIEGVAGRVIVTTVPGQRVRINVDPALIGPQLPANPSCGGLDNPTGFAQLVYDTAGGVYRQCSQNRTDTFRHQRFITSDITINSGTSPGFPQGGSIGGASYWFVNTLGTEGLSAMGFNLSGTTSPLTFPAGTLIPAIRIEETGLYAVRANVDVLIEGAIRAIRFFLYTNNTKTMVVNMKEGVETTTPPTKYIVPDGANAVSKTFSGYNLVRLNKGEYLFMGVRVFTPDPAPFKFTILSEALPLDAPFGGGSSGNLCGTTFGCQLVSRSALNSS